MEIITEIISLYSGYKNAAPTECLSINNINYKSSRILNIIIEIIICDDTRLSYIRSSAYGTKIEFYGVPNNFIHRNIYKNGKKLALIIIELLKHRTVPVLDYEIAEYINLLHVRIKQIKYKSAEYRPFKKLFQSTPDDKLFCKLYPELKKSRKDSSQHWIYHSCNLISYIIFELHDITLIYRYCTMNDLKHLKNRLIKQVMLWIYMRGFYAAVLNGSHRLTLDALHEIEKHI